MSVESDSVLNSPNPVDPPPGPVDPIEAAPNDESNYLLAEDWFSDIQDDGIKLTVAEVETWHENQQREKQITLQQMESIAKCCMVFPKSYTIYT